MLRKSLVFIALAAACSSSGDAKDAKAKKATDGPTKAAGAKVVGDDDVCNALTPADVEAELHVKTTARVLPKAGEYSAPSCGWLESDAPDARGVSVTMFLQDNETDAKSYFAKKLATLCDQGRTEVADLGDEAAFCGMLWVRKGSSYFAVTVSGFKGTREEWTQLGPRLAARILPRLP